jgi:hypothetical protein
MGGPVDRWFLVACLAVVGGGVLAFLRIVTNEIELVEKEVDHLRRREQAKKRRPPAEVIDAAAA